MKTTPRLLATILLAALVASACSGGDDAGTVSDRFGGDAQASATTMAASAETPLQFSDEDQVESATPTSEDTAGGERDSATNAQEVAAIAANLGRSIIFTANLTIEVDDVVAAGAELSNAVAGLGGILFGQETTTGEFPRSVLTIKVPPDRFDDALDRMAGVGTLVSQSIFADDVTDRVVDLESRISTAEVSVERLRTLLAAAGAIEDVVQLESELVKRETELEVLRGQLRTLEDAVSLATIVVVLTEPTPDEPMPALEMVQTAYVGHDGGAGCPGSDELTIDEDIEMTVCFSILNTGDTRLADIVVRDFGLDMDDEDLFAVVGDLDAPLGPGDELILAFETVADPDEYTSPGIDVTAVDEAGEPLRIPVEVEVEDAFLRIIGDTSLPGFTDGLEAAWGALQRVFGVLVLAAGAAIPFLWVPALAGGAWWWRKRRTAS